jgi:uncharacterized protein (TIGR00299 family) protein
VNTLYFDCFSGASGDMILGALVDAGLPLDDLRRALGSLAVGSDAVWTERVDRAGVSATKFNVRGEDVPHSHAHNHDHSHGGDHEHAHDGDGHRHDHHHADGPEDGHDHRTRAHSVHGDAAGQDTAHTHRRQGEHRTLADIFQLIDGSALSGAGKDRAKALFNRLGEAESAIHGVPMEQVHLHEVGALDSIVDIVGTVYALETLRAERVVSSPLNVGGGTVRSAHGTYPVPAPATVRLLEGAPIYAGAQRVEMVTPTGALLVTGYATEYGPVPAMRLMKVGYGAGSRNPKDTPNVLRVLIGESDSIAASHNVVVIEAEIDDMNPQIFGLLMDRVLAEGALDVFYTAIQMKKNRPGTLLTIVAAPDARERLTAIVFRETTTIGVRYREMARECLDRETVRVETPLGAVRFKIARRNGQVLNASPEFDDCARIAGERDLPLKDVQAAAMKAFLDRTP